MKKVITYGTYDLLHEGHIRLLERAKALGDYLIVGVTSEDFDKKRGKINVQQSLMERIEGVKKTGLADEIIVEEYQGQKIEDIIKYGIDIFTVGSDWTGKFDYLKEYCDVIYLSRTEGISSTQIRQKNSKIKLGLVGDSDILLKIAKESYFINGLELTDIYSNLKDKDFKKYVTTMPTRRTNYEQLLKNVDTIYLISSPNTHFEYIEKALKMHKHVLCESPITLSYNETKYLYDLAKTNNCVLMDALKTAYSTAYSRLILMIKSGVIGKVVSVDATCTSLKEINEKNIKEMWNSICAWGPTAMLPIFQILGTNYRSTDFFSIFSDYKTDFDLFTKINFNYDYSTATLKVGVGAKSEGELIITGTKGYIYVPSPWWKTDYFETRYENQAENKRYFYQLDGEGIRNELLSFSKAIKDKVYNNKVSVEISNEISNVLEKFYKKNK